MQKITKLLEIGTRTLFVFSAFIAYIGFFWFPEQGQLLELIFATILLLLALASFKVINKILYIGINLVGAVILLYLIYSGSFSITMDSILFYVVQMIGFFFLIFITRYRN